MKNVELKGVDEVTAIINEFLAPFELTCKLGLDFGYYPSDNLITYAFTYVDIDVDGFLASVERLEPEVNADIFLWSLLHEVGHHETIDEMTAKENRACDKAKAKINKKVKKLNKRMAKGKKVKLSAMVKLESYYDMLDERLATEWAVNYANTHKEELAKFWEKLGAAIRNFYELNEVEV